MKRARRSLVLDPGDATVPEQGLGVDPDHRQGGRRKARRRDDPEEDTGSSATGVGSKDTPSKYNVLGKCFCKVNGAEICGMKCD